MTNSNLSAKEKIEHMHQLAEYRKQLCENPKLHSLFIEMTLSCNEHCRHCGSECDASVPRDILTADEIKAFLDTVKEDFDISNLELCITGGEPLLRSDFFEIMNYAHKLGFAWGMTSNGTLITPEIAEKLKKTGMRTISVSVDGLEAEHDWFRNSIGSYKKTIGGIRNLLEVGFEHVQITSVIHKRNIKQLNQMYTEFKKLGVRSWRVVNVEPIGRAREDSRILLNTSEIKKMLIFIRKNRYRDKMQVSYGCSHFLGTRNERELRKWYFLCNAGLYTASVCCNGDIRACLDIERRPELIEGNIRRDRFSDIWTNGYRIYRNDFRKTGKCESCKNFEFCNGDSFHTWDFEKMEAKLCMKGILFK